MDLYLVRHGQSEFNIGLTDYLDSDLTPKGREQADLTALRLARICPNRIFVSPLNRTIQTARPLCAATGIPAEMVPGACEYFSNESYRTFPGRNPSDIYTQYSFLNIGSIFPFPTCWWPQEIETDKEIIARVIVVRDALISHFAATDNRIVLISHADTVGRLTEVFLRHTPVPNDPPWSDNCAITLLRCAGTDEAAELVYANDSSHLTHA